MTTQEDYSAKANFSCTLPATQEDEKKGVNFANASAVKAATGVGFSFGGCSKPQPKQSPLRFGQTTPREGGGGSGLFGNASAPRTFFPSLRDYHNPKDYFHIGGPNLTVTKKDNDTFYLSRHTFGSPTCEVDISKLVLWMKRKPDTTYQAIQNLTLLNAVLHLEGIDSDGDNNFLMSSDGEDKVMFHQHWDFAQTGTLSTNTYNLQGFTLTKHELFTLLNFIEHYHKYNK